MQVRVFVNQLYQPNLVREISKNPDLQAIRIASVNPILDPWIYILLRKTVLSKAIEKIKCLFCRIGGSRRDRSGQHCSDSRRTSSAVSGHSRSFLSRELREISSTSQNLFLLCILSFCHDLVDKLIDIKANWKYKTYSASLKCLK